MPLIIIADTPQEVLGKVADWLVDYVDVVAQSVGTAQRDKAVRADTIQLIAMVLRAGTVMSSAAFDPAKHPYVEPPRPPMPRWNRRLPMVKGTKP